MTTFGFHEAKTAYLPAFNNALTDIGAGLGVVLDTAGGGAGTDTWVRLPTTAEALTGAASPFSIVVQTIKTKSWGDIVNRPGVVVPCTAGAAVTKGVYVKISSVAGQEGRFIAAADGDPYIGVAMSGAAAAGDKFYVKYQPGSHA